MLVSRYYDAESFAADAMEMLMRAEAQNNLIIGRAIRFIEQGVPGDVLLIALKDGGTCVAAAMMTPPHRLVLTEVSREAIDWLIQWMQENSISLPGACGPANAARDFVDCWQATTGACATLHRSLRIFQLDRIIAPPPASGAFRAAEICDLELIQTWSERFSREIGEPDPNVRANAQERLQAGHFFLWFDRQPVSMAAWAGPTPNGIRINAVYTPPEFRNRGYASACVAALSRKLLDNVRKFCFLYTDLANPTSNSVYQKLGYRAVCDWADYVL